MLSKEAEHAIRAIARIANPHGNHDAVVATVEEDCPVLLVSHRFVREVWNDPEREDFPNQEPDGYELTIHGRNYFSNKRRRWLRANSGALIASVASIAGAAIGYLLGHFFS